MGAWMRFITIAGYIQLKEREAVAIPFILLSLYLLQECSQLIIFSILLRLLMSAPGRVLNKDQLLIHQDYTWGFRCLLLPWVYYLESGCVNTFTARLQALSGSLLFCWSSMSFILLWIVVGSFLAIRVFEKFGRHDGDAVTFLSNVQRWRKEGAEMHPWNSENTPTGADLGRGTFSSEFPA